ncbi:MAG: ribosome biogenesis GTPase Der [Treponemataceae bacterium]|nr:MAG: ribosome biogenesis GTPase Der [Treponemataceae bacterium]
MSAKTALIVIAGRPNVGKSTLFNRFLHRRRAITDPTPGVTRDPIEEECVILGRRVKIMDTGGFKLEKSPIAEVREIESLVTQKTLATLERADLILLLFDPAHITAEDEEFVLLLNQYRGKVIAAANKTEGGRLENEAWNLMRFGFSDFMLISAEHGDKFPELCERITARLDALFADDPRYAQLTDAENLAENRTENAPSEAVAIDVIKIAVMGKPNTGKSTLVNALTGKELSLVCDYAGTTRDVIEGSFVFTGHRFTILDTAGIRRKARVTENLEYYSVNRAVKTLDEADIVFLLIDALEGFSEQDKKIAALATERGRAVVFVLNKWDGEIADDKRLKKMIADIRIMFAHMDWAPVLPLSAKTGKGIKTLLKTALELSSQLNKKISTASLNIALHDWTADHPAPANAGFKLRYIVQKSANPVLFYVFAGRNKNVMQSYISYIKNRIRTDLGFDKIPVLIEVR